MQFQEPEFLYVLAILVFLPVLAIAYWRKNLFLNKFFRLNPPARWSHAVLLGATAVLLGSGIVLLARPYHMKESPAVRADIVALVDVSLSMGARKSLDSPSRLGNAQEALLRITDEVPGIRMQIIPYTRVAFPIVDFTADNSLLREAVQNGLFLESTSRGGSWLLDILLVLLDEKANNPDYAHVRHVLLFSDGVSTSSLTALFLPELTERLNDAGLSVSAMGFGSVAGERIPIFNSDGRFTGNYVMVNNGTNFVPAVVFLDENILAGLANGTGGIYMHESDQVKFIREFENMLPRTPLPGIEYSAPQQKDLSWIFAAMCIASLTVLCVKGELP